MPRTQSATTSLISALQRAGKSARHDLELVGAHAGYSWPTTPSRLWQGYSYEIPKEEQIRSAFWAHLHDRNSLVCELEWNHYGDQERVGSVRSEIDLVGFARTAPPTLPVLLLEFKRVWRLKPQPSSRWLNKTAEMKDGIKNDIRKLRRVLKSFSSHAGPPPLAGVVVVAFSDDPTNLAPPWTQWDVWPTVSEEYELWAGETPLCRTEIAEGETREIYSRADLLVVTTASEES